MPAESPRTFSCPNCGAAGPPGAGVCPNCGHVRAVWPSPPSGLAPVPPPPAPQLVTGKTWGDLTLGMGLSSLFNLIVCVAAFPSNFVFILGLPVVPILYRNARKPP